MEQHGAERATYGQALLTRLAEDLTGRFGRGFSRANLVSMRAFYPAWPPEQICQTLSGKSADAEKGQTPSGKSLSAASGTASPSQFAQLAACFALPWSVYVRLLSVKSPAARAFYGSKALRQGWSVRQLDR
ncbi:DUF1016 N-terminal domain-containing protein [Mycetohabitans endofungorum]